MLTDRRLPRDKPKKKSRENEGARLHTHHPDGKVLLMSFRDIGGDMLVPWQWPGVLHSCHGIAWHDPRH